MYSAISNFGAEVNYVIASGADAGGVITAIFGFIAANMPFVLAILGPVVGWKFAKRLLNGATHGRIS